MKQIFSLFFILLIMGGCGFFRNKEKISEVITLSNEHLKIVIAPQLGGRLIYWGSPGDSNFLKVNEKAWTDKSPLSDSKSLEIPFFGYDGMITWLGPQSEWWMQQDVVPDLKAEKAVWPPDPYLIYGDFEVLSLTDRSVTIVSPHSLVSGITMTKSFSLEKNRMNLEVVVENTGKKTVAWDIWTNSRFDVRTEYCIPVANDKQVRVEDYSENVNDSVLYRLENDCFSFLLPDTAGLGNGKYKAKAFLNADYGRIVVFKENKKLTIKFDDEEVTAIHLNHGLMEVYVALTGDKTKNLLELEHHSAYHKLHPGESMRKDQTWVLEDFE
jgi:hypothetical protein